MQTTRRHPRTLEEAFGPGHRGGIHEEPIPFTLADKVIMAIAGVTMVGLLTAILTGVI
jgi:hypothetical protein|uniref:Uncharacterized protein n=1 Tax=Podoviridae sp. ctwJH20 TaxID=2827753 RepID=A0A8S5TBG1_9CAUD|nr:MAG TPA: hypothetical protein [Podoviridae sp. ctwJH20]